MGWNLVLCWCGLLLSIRSFAVLEYLMSADN
jgi:hypothetical protein